MIAHSPSLKSNRAISRPLLSKSFESPTAQAINGLEATAVHAQRSKSLARRRQRLI
jgi:hypothetical protein